MSSEIDPAKLKVVDLRSELGARGLDTKGNKAVLVKRLKEALEEELKKDLPDTSITDTSNEDLNSSEAQDEPETVDESEPPKAETVITPAVEEEKMETTEVDDPKVTPEGEVEEAQEEETEKSCQKEVSVETNVENGEETDSKPEPVEEPDRSHKTRWGAEEAQTEPKDADEEAKTEETVAEGEKVASEENEQEKEEPKPVADAQPEPRGDKRKRESPSPERSSRRRSKTPIREDEPVIDSDKVQLNWYDSDLHLQVDKESFLSAKPYHEGAFGYAWAGVRATHGVAAGKVCFEVKVTEELKWEDLVRHQDRSGRRDRDRQRRDSRSEKKKDEEKKDPSPEKTMEVDQPEEDKSEEGGQKVAVPEAKQEGEQTQAEEVAKVADEPKDELKDDPKEEPKEEPKQEPKEELKEESKDEPMNESKDESKEETQEEIPPVETEETEPQAGEKEEKKEKREEKMEVDEPKIEPVPSHLFRVGWSTLETGLQLGEYKNSFGYESSGKFVTDNTFEEYGIKYVAGDVIGSFLEITSEDVNITYTVNGVLQPVAFTAPRSDFPEEGFALFPHVLSRNCAFEFNLGSREEPWFAAPTELSDYVFLEKADDKVVGPLRPETRSECEVVMMCGLPGSGKTHWVREWVEKNPDKRYTVIGNTHLLERMTVNGGPLKNSYRGRWNVILDKLQKCLNRLVDVAALRRRNYIIDQTNVFPSAQRRKMRPFEGFKRRAVVVVVGDEEQAKRRAQQEAQDGKDVPDSAVLEMKANMGLPRVCDWLEEVEFADLGDEEAKALVQKYNTQGRDAGFGPLVHQRKDFRNDRNRWYNNRRMDYRPGNYREKNYYNNRYDNRGPRGGSWHQSPRSGGGGAYRGGDRRDSRGPPPSSRDWRSQGRTDGRDGSRSHGGSSSYNRNRDSGSSSSSGRSRGGNWQGSGGGGGGYGWNQGGGGGGGGNWGQGAWQQGGQGGGNWSGQSGWKYGQGYPGYGSSYSNYYYGGGQ